MEVTIEISIVMFFQNFDAFRAHVCTNQRQQLLRSERWLEFALRGTLMRVSGKNNVHFLRIFCSPSGQRVPSTAQLDRRKWLVELDCSHAASGGLILKNAISVFELRICDPGFQSTILSRGTSKADLCSRLLQQDLVPHLSRRYC